MKRGLRFQTKLMLTFVVAIAVVSFALIAATESKVADAYRRQFSGDFQRLVRQLKRSHEERSEEFQKLCEKLAAHPYIIASLEGEGGGEQAGSFWKTYRETLGQLESGQDSDPSKRQLPVLEMIERASIVGIITPDGKLRTLEPAALSGAGAALSKGIRPGEGRRFDGAKLRQRKGNLNQAKDRIAQLLASREQEVLYLPFENAEGHGFVQEMMSTPVFRPGTDELIGHFLRTVPAETEAQRFLERYQEEFKSDSPLITGIYLDGELFSRTVDPKISAKISAVLQERLPEAIERGRFAEKDSTAFDDNLDGVPYRFYVAPLTANTAPHSAYQISAFSLATLKTDLAELRLRGSGVGGVALLLGIMIAWVLSRRLAVPIADLTRATHAIESGALDTRIAIRSRDEIGELAASFNEMAEGLQQRDAYRGILGKVSDETVAQAMISGDLDLELGGELKTVSVLFCDIRGFTALSENMPPTELIALLNEHMTAMTAIVRKHYGVVDKFVGDEIMAVFGALKSYGNDAGHAVACALEMVAERERLNQTAAHPLQIGIGVATGEAVAGCMGSVDRLNYTVVGARVNLASRLCSEAGAMEVVIDDQTLFGVGHERVQSEELSDLKLKGFSESVTAYRVREAGSEVRENFDLVQRNA